MKRALFASAIVLAFASPALAADKQACVDAHSDAQRLRKAGKLIDAQRALATCSASECPGAVAQDCTTWRDEVEGAIPSIVLAARDDSGRDIVDVRVSVDGVVVATHLDGRALPIDPGEHTIRCEADGRVVELPITAHASEKARPIRIELPAAAKVTTPTPPPPEMHPTPTPDSPRHPLPVAFWLFGAIGVASLGVFSGLAIDGYSRESHLSSTCGVTHMCSPNDVGGVANEYHAADVALGATIVFVAAATIIGIVHASSSPKAPVHAGVMFAPGGAAASLQGRF
jgi:hypothetical protein